MLGKVKSDGRIALSAHTKTANPLRKLVAARDGSRSAARLAILRTLDQISVRSDVPKVDDTMRQLLDVMGRGSGNLKAVSVKTHLALLSDAADRATSQFVRTRAVTQFDYRWTPERAANWHDL